MVQVHHETKTKTKKKAMTLNCLSFGLTGTTGSDLFRFPAYVCARAPLTTDVQRHTKALAHRHRSRRGVSRGFSLTFVVMPAGARTCLHVGKATPTPLVSSCGQDFLDTRCQLIGPESGFILKIIRPCLENVKSLISLLK